MMRIPLRAITQTLIKRTGFRGSERAGLSVYFAIYACYIHTKTLQEAELVL